MKTQKRQIMILLILLIIAIGVYFGIRYYRYHPTVVHAQRVDLVNLYDLTELSIADESGAEFSFSKAEGLWTCQGEPAADGLEKIEKYLEGLYVSRTIESPDTLSAYGLDPPRYTVTAVESSGVQTVIRVGSEAQSGTYYMQVAGSDTVACASSALVTAISELLLK